MKQPTKSQQQIFWAFYIKKNGWQLRRFFSSSTLSEFHMITLCRSSTIMWVFFLKTNVFSIIRTAFDTIE